jgi:hypothetical protein
MVLSIMNGKSPWDYFNPDYFPEEVMDHSKLDFNFLKRWFLPGEYWGLNTGFRFVVLMKTDKVPEWADRFDVINIIPFSEDVDDSN